jgi:hypothetical protein
VCSAWREAVSAQVDRLALYLHTGCTPTLDSVVAFAARFTRTFPRWQLLRLRVGADGGPADAAAACLAALLQQLAQLQPQLHNLQLEFVTPCSFSLEALCVLPQLKNLSVSGATKLQGRVGGFRRA